MSGRRTFFPARWRRALALGAAIAGACGSAGCLVFTDSFNKPPKVEITGPRELFRLQPSDFHALAQDDGNGPLDYDWRFATSCPDSPAAVADLADDTSKRTKGEVYRSFQSDAPGPGCLFVVVTDGKGARGLATRPIEIKGRTLGITGPASVASNTPIQFAAAFVGDPEATARADFVWARSPTCEAALATTRAGKREKAKTVYDDTPTQSSCVAVRAWDEFGAEFSASAQLTVILKDAAIRVIAPAMAPVDGTMAPMRAGLFTRVHLSALGPGETAPEPRFTFTWQITGPAGTRTREECDANQKRPYEACFIVEQAGEWKVDLTVADMENTAKAPTLSLQVDDLPPCIQQTDPAFVAGAKVLSLFDQARIFRVIEVADDADPIPAGPHASMGEFVWSRKYGTDTAFRAIPGATFRELTLPAREHKPGDRVELRVEYRDRHERTRPMGRELGRVCNPNDATCAVGPNPACFQWVTFTVEYL